MPKVLLTEDSATQFAVVDRILRGAGFQVIRAATGEEAVELAVREKPDAVVLDIVLPGIDGFEVCRRLKETPSARDVPVMFFTLLDSPENRKRAQEVGAEDYLAKEDFDPNELVRRCQKLALQRGETGAK